MNMRFQKHNPENESIVSAELKGKQSQHTDEGRHDVMCKG